MYFLQFYYFFIHNVRNILNEYKIINPMNRIGIQNLRTQKDPEVSKLTPGLFYALNCTAHGFKFFYFSNEPYTRSTLLVRELSPYIKTRKKPQKRVNSPWGIFTHFNARLVENPGN